MYHIKKNRKAMPFTMFNFISNKLQLTESQKAKLLTHIKSKAGKTNIFPKQLTKNFLWLIGLIATDGNINKSEKNGSTYNKIRIFNSNKKIINKAKKILSKFNLTPYESICDDGNIRLEVGGTLLTDILNNYFGIPSGNKTSTVKTPQIIENLNPELIGAYLSGVFDGDGNYLKRKQKMGQQSFNYRILIVTASKDFAQGLCELFSKLGIIPKVNQFKPKPTFIKNKLANFSKINYLVVFTKIEFIKKFSKYSTVVKAKFDINYSKYNNVNKRDFSNNSFDIIKLKTKKISKTPQIVYNLEIKKNNNYFANNILVHNCGRSGRPKFSSEGKSIIQANNENQKELYLENYIKGELEPINSKLSNINVLRTHVLALIAVNEIYDDKSIWNFFEKTLFAKQSNSIINIYEKVIDIIDELIEFDFVEKKENIFVCTKIGKRVSDLFLDPKSAFTLVSALKNKKSFTPMSYLFAWSNCNEFFPIFRIPKKLNNIIFEEFNSRLNEIPFKREELLFEENFLDVFYSAMLLEKWINEENEQELFTSFGLAPGVLFGKTRVLEWLAYSTIEISKVIEEERHLLKAKNISLRIKYGVREELLQLVELKGIGRVRARKLFNLGIKKPLDIKKNYLKAESILGKKVFENIKKQLKI
jgi:hypothetical protein